MSAMQRAAWARELFSSALFCLWLSTASIAIIWFGVGFHGKPRATVPPPPAGQQAEVP